MKLSRSIRDFCEGEPANNYIHLARHRRPACLTHHSLRQGDDERLVAHHLGFKQHHRHVAESIANLITLSAEVHERFHGWNGGYAKPCTPDDLIRFVQQLYPQRSVDVTIKIENAKRRLGAHSASV